MHGLSEPSLFPTKKNPAPAGDDKGQIRPALRESEMHLSMASVSGVEREKSLLCGGIVPGKRSMAQS